MPKSRTRAGVKKSNSSDRGRVRKAFLKKLQEYDGYPLDQLITMRMADTEKGVYLLALNDVIEHKRKNLEPPSNLERG